MSTQFFINNEIDNATAVVSSQNAQYPLSNLNDTRRTKVFRSTSNSTTLTFDFGYPVLINSVMIADDPMTGNNLLTCLVKIDNSNTFGTAIAQSMTIDTINGFSYTNFTTTVPVRYMRLEMTSSAGFCEIASLFAGSKVTLGTEIDFSLPLSFSLINKANATINRYGQKFIDEINTQKKISGSLKSLDRTELDGVLSILDYSNTSRPLWVQFDSVLNNPNRLSGCYYLSNSPSMTLDSSLYWSLNVELEEAL
jgi:hypothetical protein